MPYLVHILIPSRSLSMLTFLLPYFRITALHIIKLVIIYEWGAVIHLSAGKFTCDRVISRTLSFRTRNSAARCGSFTGIQDERVSPHIYDKHLNARARCADTNPLPRGLSATYSSRYTARKIILVLKWRIIPRDVFNDAPYTRFVPEAARPTKDCLERP